MVQVKTVLSRTHVWVFCECVIAESLNAICTKVMYILIHSEAVKHIFISWSEWEDLRMLIY
jgi:hypothetical protein